MQLRASLHLKTYAKYLFATLKHLITSSRLISFGKHRSRRIHNMSSGEPLKKRNTEINSANNANDVKKENHQKKPIIRKQQRM